MSNSTIVLIVLFVVALSIAGFWAYRSGFFNRGKGGKAKVVSSTNGFYLLANGKYDKAMDELRDVVIHIGGTPDIYISMAVLYRKRGELGKAIHICEGLLLRKELPSEVLSVVLKELAAEYRIAKDISRGLECLERIKPMANPDCLLPLRAAIASAQGDYELAIKFYTKYEKAARTTCDKEISWEYMKMAKAEPTPDRRKKVLKNAIKAYPKNKEAYFELASICFTDGEIEEGLEQIKTIIRKDIGRTADDTRRITDAFYHHSTIDDLIALASERVATDSINPLSYLFLSKIYNKRGNMDRAKEILKHYMMVHEPRVVVVRAYAHLAADDVLLRVAQEDNYICSECGAQYVEFVDICTSCGSIDTLNYY